MFWYSVFVGEAALGYAVVADHWGGEDEDLAAMAAATSELEEVCSSLIKAAIDRGSDDNVSVIVVRVGLRAADGTEAARGDGRFNGGLIKKLTTFMRPQSANH